MYMPWRLEVAAARRSTTMEAAVVFARIVLFGPDFNMGCVNLDSDEEQEAMEIYPSSLEVKATPPQACLQMVCSMVGNNYNEDPLRHYVS
jgi:hypothetical protein